MSSLDHKFLIAAMLSDLVEEAAYDDLERIEVRLAEAREECRDVLERCEPERRDDFVNLELCDLDALERDVTEVGPPGVTAVCSGSEPTWLTESPGVISFSALSSSEASSDCPFVPREC